MDIDLVGYEDALDQMDWSANCWLWTWPLWVGICFVLLCCGLLALIVSGFSLNLDPRLSASEIIPHKC